MNTITNKSYLVRHLSHITPLKISKACIDSFKPLGTTLKMGTKGITLVNARNLTMTFKTASESTKNKRDIKYATSTWI